MMRPYYEPHGGSPKPLVRHDCTKTPIVLLADEEIHNLEEQLVAQVLGPLPQQQQPGIIPAVVARRTWWQRVRAWFR